MAAATTNVSQDVHKLAHGNLGFALKLYENIVSRNKVENVFFSPFSITLALQMTHVGARKNTAKEMKETMKLHKFKTKDNMHKAFSDVLQLLNPEKQPSLTLQIANQLYVENSYEIDKDYAQTLMQHYQALAIGTDFVKNAEGARQEINKWVEGKTLQKIQNLIPEGALDAMTRLVIVNAIYFKGNWARKFHPEKTAEGNFYRKTNDIVKTRLMRQEAKFPYHENDDLDCKLIELSYIGNKLVMYILLPNDVEGLGALEQHLNAKILKSMIASLRESKVNVVLPKFKLKHGLPLKDVLKAVGIQELFLENDADLTGISPKGDLYVSDAFHKAFVEVNEEGTEAAAATAEWTTYRSRVRDNEFTADHPFLFLIYEKQSKLILFLGRLANPSV